MALLGLMEPMGRLAHKESREYKVCLVLMDRPGLMGLTVPMELQGLLELLVPMVIRSFRLERSLLGMRIILVRLPLPRSHLTGLDVMVRQASRIYAINF